MRILIALGVAGVLYVFWNVISNWLQHAFGFERGAGNTPQYLFWSGSGSDLAYFGWLWAAGIYYRKNNCRRTWCPWLGHHDFTDPKDGVTRRLCDYHHPDVVYRRLSDDVIAAIHKRRVEARTEQESLNGS